MSSFIDMTGWVMKEHGVPDSLITIIRQVHDYISRQDKHTPQWLCQCECGSEPFVTTGPKLRNGHTKSCGCKRKNCEDKVRVKHNLTGQVFGRLTVVEQAEDYIAPSDKKHYAQWLCLCECGNLTVIRATDLTQNVTRSCGCLSSETTAQRNTDTCKEYNNYDISTKRYGVGLTHNTNQEFYFDLEDYDKIKDICWIEFVNKDGYHSLTGWDPNTKRMIKMHWIIFGGECDHADRNPLNNQKNNLRDATNSQQCMNRNKQKNNTSGFIGVGWNKTVNKWVAYVNSNGKRIHLGSFDNKNEAITVRLQAEAKYYGEFAPQRHLFEQYGIEYNPEDKVKGGDSNG